MSDINEFRVNKYLMVKLEKNNGAPETVIYVAGKRFRQCKYLLLEIPLDTIKSFDEIDSIDEAASKLDHSQERGELFISKIPPEVEFWGHCSNLQVWYENNYNTRLLHSNLAFPLLKKLTKAGDPQAKRVFKEEIVKRWVSGFPPVLKFLNNWEDNYMSFLNQEELYSLIDIKEQLAIDELNKTLTQLAKNELKILPGSADEWEDLPDVAILIEGSHVSGLKIKTVKGRVPYDKVRGSIHQEPLKILPDCIKKFNHLKFLNIRNNELDNLPKWIGEFNKLEMLFIEDNRIKSLPEELLNLNKLSIFYYYNNNLGEDSKIVLEKLESKGIKLEY